MSERPSPWRTPFAIRTYWAGIFWAIGLGLTALNAGQPVTDALRPRLDAVGLAYLTASLIGGSNFFGAGVRAARALRLDMNFLMTVAILAALLIGEAFEAATIAFLFSSAELLERFAADRSRRAITRLLELAPDEADRLFPDGAIQRVPAASLEKGQRVRIRPGGRIPADGIVVAGESSVNESTITGESLPQPKRPGDKVFAGTLNVDGSLDVDVEADPAHSVLARIVQLVRTAESRRAPIEHFVERFSRIYTPTVTGIALLVILVPLLSGASDPVDWFRRGLTLLVVACPCALVIATPVTVVSALTSAARHGVLIKGGSYLEALGSVRAIAVDKTGTITRGTLVVSDFQTSGFQDPRRALSLIAALESRSEHPIAQAIVSYASDQGIARHEPVHEFKALPGRGIDGKVGNAELMVGTQELIGTERAAAWPPPPPGTIRVFARTSDDRQAIVDLRDEIRPTAKRVVRRLHEIGITPVVMLTGDAQEVANAVAGEVGVDEVQGRLLPDEKVEAVRSLRERYKVVAMVGDGVNDAPALATANVGIAMGGAGSPATIETADVALMNDDLTRLPYVFTLGRRTRRTIRFNVGTALGLKLVLAVGAILGVVSLAAAVLVGDLGASIAVTLNAIRLAGTQPDA